jgi:hypothetical protein
MTSTTALHTFELPYTTDDLDEVGGSEEQYQAALDAEVAELRAEVEAIGFRPRKADEPEERAKLPLLAEVFARAMPSDPRTREPLFTAADVLGWVERAIEHDCTIPRLRAEEVEDVFRLRRIPNALLREEYLRQQEEHEDDGLPTLIAHKIGAVSNGKPDVTYVKRILGVEPQPGSKGYAPTFRFFVPYEQAVAIADALDLDYHELGV